MMSADVPSADTLRFTLLTRAADRAASFLHHDLWYQGMLLAVRPSGWRQAVLRRTSTVRMWPLADSPFDGLCIGEDHRFYMMHDDKATEFVIANCTPADITRITNILLDMAAPTAW